MRLDCPSSIGVASEETAVSVQRFGRFVHDRFRHVEWSGYSGNIGEMANVFIKVRNEFRRCRAVIGTKGSLGYWSLQTFREPFIKELSEQRPKFGKRTGCRCAQRVVLMGDIPAKKPVCAERPTFSGHTAPTVLPVHGTRGSRQDKLPGPEDIPGPPAGHEC